MNDFQQEECTNVSEVYTCRYNEMYHEVPRLHILGKVAPVLQVVPLQETVDAPVDEVVHDEIGKTPLKRLVQWMAWFSNPSVAVVNQEHLQENKIFDCWYGNK